MGVGHLAGGVDDGGTGTCVTNDDCALSPGLETCDPASGECVGCLSDADCIGEGFVDEIGTEQLQEYGFLTEDLKAAEDFTNVEMSKEDAGSAADTLIECADVQQMMSEAMGEVDAKTRECFEEVLTEEALRSLFTKMFSGQQEEAGQELIQPMMECAAPGLQDQ